MPYHTALGKIIKKFNYKTKFTYYYNFTLRFLNTIHVFLPRRVYIAKYAMCASVRGIKKKEKISCPPNGEHYPVQYYQSQLDTTILRGDTTGFCPRWEHCTSAAHKAICVS